MITNTDSSHNPGLFRAHVMMHGAVVLYGLTGILGRLIELPSLTIVWYRMLFTLLSLCLFPGMIRTVRQMPRRQFVKVAGIGMLLTLHWLTFFAAIKRKGTAILRAFFGFEWPKFDAKSKQNFT